MSSPEHAAPHADRSNPWKTLSSRAVYENPWIRVREDQVLRPDGLPGIYGVVHFKNRAVGVLPVDDDGAIWLVGQYRYPLASVFLGDPRRGRPRRPNRPKRRPGASCARRPGSTAGRLELVATAHLSNSVSDELGYRLPRDRADPRCR